MLGAGDGLAGSLMAGPTGRQWISASGDHGHYTYPAAASPGLGLVGMHPLWQIIARRSCYRNDRGPCVNHPASSSVGPIERALISAIAGIM
jgi:hypothetical protein